MTVSDIETRADFDDIRYAQLWEDADVLVHALGEQKNNTLVSICSAGDNALAMLLLDPARVIVLDVSPAQIACLQMRIAAIENLEHAEFLTLIGARSTLDREKIFDHLLELVNADLAQFWEARRRGVLKHGLGGVGKFERYFRIFQKYLLPLAHSRATIDDVFVSKPFAERASFFEGRWNNLRWRTLLKLFFSNTVMGRLGRDSAFFDHVDGSLADHVASKLFHVGVDLDPSGNPYIHYILKGEQGEALPLAWRPEHYQTIRSRLNRLEVRCGSLEAFISSGEKADGFNLSDIFEYMDEKMFEEVYGSILGAANPNARLVYWNMMVLRRMPRKYSGRIETLRGTEGVGKAMDKAFFYSDFVVEKVI